jgi:DNA-binding PucR family transcriptional regulator
MNKEELSTIIDGIDEMSGDECKAFVKGFVMSLDIFCEMQDAEDTINEMEKRIKELEEERKNMVRKRPMINYSSLYDAKRSSKKASYVRGLNSRFYGIVLDFEKREDAQAALDELEETIDEYGKANVSDLFAIAELPIYSDMYKYGWEDIGDASIYDFAGRYRLQMPAATKNKEG